MKKRKENSLNQQTEININNHKKILLAFSGGLDSTVLLNILIKLQNKYKIYQKKKFFSLRAIHIHHGLHKKADNWALHCKNECIQKNIPINIIKIPKIISSTRKNIEAKMRNERYKILTKFLLPNEILVTAHHQDDQAETILLALKRGSGPNGIKSMSPDILFIKKNKLIRPLLNCSREKLEKYAKQHKLNWIQDESNLDINFDRNFLRINILPILKKRWPWFSNSAARTAQLCSNQEILLNELLQNILKKLIQKDGSIRFTKLITLSTIQRTALLRKWITNKKITPSKKQLECLWNNVVTSKRDSAPKFKLSNKFICRFQDRLYLISEKKINKNINNIILTWNKQDKKIKLPKNLGIIFRCSIKKNYENIIKNLFSQNKHCITIQKENSEIEFILSNLLIKKHFEYMIPKNKIIKKNTKIQIVRSPKKNETTFIRFEKIHNPIHIFNQKKSKTLKKIWKELSIPPWERTKIPFLFYNEKLIAAMGIFVTKEGNKNCKKAKLYFYCKNFEHP
ncbi:MAG: tRNA(Ile)-lysidine synthetase [Candidatus Westeberhardia cardiocondylae]|nr:tRNA(Ile)-lysidine synthetase [Candidatus Westeberhardia cardiocondylae]